MCYASAVQTLFFWHRSLAKRVVVAGGTKLPYRTGFSIRTISKVSSGSSREIATGYFVIVSPIVLSHALDYPSICER